MGGAGKHIQQARWRALPLEALAGAGELQGLAALEECTDYELGGAGARAKKNPKKRKSKPVTLKEQEPSPKKQKLTTGFVVESCKGTKPSTGTGVQSPQKQKEKNRRKNDKKDRQKKQNEDRQKRNFNKKQDPASEVQTEAGESKMLEEMSAWSHFQMPEEILRALSEQGFAKPTKIQELCLPPAMLGRRDILGAAETGSGKTLAFGIPILAGIMKLKEKQLAGQDVYELQYKKTSVKKITKEPENEVIKKIKYNNSKKNNSKRILSKDDESDSDESSSDEDAKEENANSDNESDEIDEGIESQEVSDDNQDSTAADDAQSDSDEYIHLSEMYDSEDLADSTNDEKDNSEETFDEMNGDENYSDEDVDADHVGEGMGCVKVIEDVEMPSHVVTKTGKPLYALVVTPTRELAMQVTRHLVAAAKYTGIRVAVLVGGMAQVKQERLLAQGPEIVVCTPGRLWELMQQGNAHLQQVDNIKFLAIDETDRMLEANHFEELHPLLERINSDERRRAARQNFVFSATLTMVHDLPAHLKGKKVTKRGKIINRKVQKMTPQQKTKKLINMLGMTDPKIIDITASKGTAETLTECRITCALEQKDYYLYYVLRRHPGRTIVFCNSIGCVKRLAQLFGLLKCHPLPLHAGMPQRQRLKNLERFREDPHGVLVATDVAARGLDIPDVDHVIHYQVPRTAENYVHRSGRTARANKEGLTILMMEPGEAFLYSKLCRTLNKTEELQPFPVPGHVLLSMKECVTLARDLERMALASKRRAQEAGWLDRVARDCDIVVDEDFVPMKKKIADMDNSVATPKQLQLKRKQLDAMLSKPVFPKGFSYKYPSLNASDALAPKVEENALQAMKRVLATGELKKEKRTSKNAPLLRLEKEFGPKLDGNKVKNVPKDGKVEKKKKKKFYKV